MKAHFLLVSLQGALCLPAQKPECTKVEAQHSYLSENVCGYSACFKQSIYFSSLEELCAPGCQKVIELASAKFQERCPGMELTKESYTSWRTSKVIAVRQWADKEGARLMCSSNSSPSEPKEPKELPSYSTSPSAKKSKVSQELPSYNTSPSSPSSLTRSLPRPRSNQPSKGYNPQPTSNDSSSAPSYGDTCQHALSRADAAILSGGTDQAAVCNSCTLKLLKKYESNPFALPVTYNNAPFDPQDLFAQIRSVCPREPCPKDS